MQGRPLIVPFVFGRRTACDVHAGAVLRKLTRDTPADTFRRSGHDGDLTFRLHIRNCIGAGGA